MHEQILDLLTATGRQEAARRYVESAEAWLRKLVHFELSKRYGVKYLTNGPWKKSLKESVVGKISPSGSKFPREVDATTFEQLIDIACHPTLGWEVCKAGLAGAYPNGDKEARTFLDRIRSIRNDVSHGRTCSSRQLEQAVCYSNDLSDSIKSYFMINKLEREFNVPTFVGFRDNIGNADDLPVFEFYYRGVDLSTHGLKRLYPGDILVVETEVDPSFVEETYDITWQLKSHPNTNGVGSQAIIHIGNEHISARMELLFVLRTKNDWHKGAIGDDAVEFIYRVLPPLSHGC